MSKWGQLLLSTRLCLLPRRYLLSPLLQRPLWTLQRSVQTSQGESKQLCKPKFSSVTSTTSCIPTAGVSQVVTADDKRTVTVVAPYICHFQTDVRGDVR